MHQDSEVWGDGGAADIQPPPLPSMLRPYLTALIHNGDKQLYVTEMIMKLLWKSVVILLLL